MRAALFAALTSAGILFAATAGAQTSSPATGVFATGIPPNAIDRATAITDRRRADAAQASATNRLDAERAARAASDRRGPVAGSTLTDGVSGLGTRPDVASPPSTTAPPQ